MQTAHLYKILLFCVMLMGSVLLIPYAFLYEINCQGDCAYIALALEYIARFFLVNLVVFGFALGKEINPKNYLKNVLVTEFFFSIATFILFYIAQNHNGVQPLFVPDFWKMMDRVVEFGVEIFFNFVLGVFFLIINLSVIKKYFATPA